MIGEEGKRQHVLIKEFNTFIHDHTLHRGRKHFCHYYFEASRTAEKLRCHIKYCFKVNGKQKIKTPEKDEYVRLKSYERKIKLLIMIYTDFESILVPEDNGKQNPNEFYMNKY